MCCKFVVSFLHTGCRIHFIVDVLEEYFIMWVVQMTLQVKVYVYNHIHMYTFNKYVSCSWKKEWFYLSILGLGFSVLGLQVAAFFFMILSTAVTIYSFFCSKDDANDDYSCCDNYVHLFVCFYPIAGNITCIDQLKKSYLSIAGL